MLVCECPIKLISTFSQHPPRHSVRPSSCPRIHCPQLAPHLVFLHYENVVVMGWYVRCYDCLHLKAGTVQFLSQGGITVSSCEIAGLVVGTGLVSAGPLPHLPSVAAVDLVLNLSPRSCFGLSDVVGCASVVLFPISKPESIVTVPQQDLGLFCHPGFW